MCATWRRRCRTACGALPTIRWSARCAGSASSPGIELVRDKQTKAPFPPQAGVAALIQAKCQEHGVIVRSLGDTIAFCPPLVITEAEIEELLRRFGKGFAEAAAIVARRGGGRPATECPPDPRRGLGLYSGGTLGGAV